ncbi:type I-E CRISPR-associated protein Cse1/CasA [Desulfobacterales bacterium HSG16]|nr:type I-E CRISPR-associated protein Cse1/CasA [Desulfobacterales bacterium HSG16]
MSGVLLGRIHYAPYHPDPPINSFLRYLPSLFLQALDPDIAEDEWNDLRKNGVDAESIGAYREKVEALMLKHCDLFQLYPDKNGFYQHHNVVADKKLKTDLDAMLIHFICGNNPVHSHVNGSLQQICLPCALLALMHHDNFCLAGTLGHSNFRGQTCYLCMIHESDIFKRMVLNTWFRSANENDEPGNNGWESPSGEGDNPTWVEIGREVKNGFEDNSEDVGIRRAVLYTPRHAFFDVEHEEGQCDLCGQVSNTLVRRYYWERYGNKLNSQGVTVRHPTQAVYMDSKNGFLPVNYNPSVWRNLGVLVLKNYESINKKNNAIQFKAAPIVTQFVSITEESVPFTLELMAFEANQAKLFDFHHDRITLPPFTDDDEMEQFYQRMETFALAVVSMLNAFRSYGTKDKKRQKVQIAAINDRHAEFTQRFGRKILDGITRFREIFDPDEENELFSRMKEMLKSYKNEMLNDFENLCQNEYSWDNIKAQEKLIKQKSGLAGTLSRIINDFYE